MDYKAALKTVKKFLTSQETLNARLIEAVKAGDVAKVKAAAAGGASANAQEKGWNDNSALTLAIEGKNLEMLKTLLELKADPDAKIGYGGKLALHEAIRAGQTDMAVALIDAGAQLNATDDSRRTPLMLAIHSRNKALSDLILSKEGVKADIVDRSGWTALSFAVANGDTGNIAALLAKNVRTDRRDNEDRTLLDIAYQYQQPAATKALNAHYDSLVPKWQKLEDADEVAHVSFLREAGYKLTEIFNLRTNRVTTVTHNFETGRDETATRGLTEADKTAVAEAAAKLAALKPQAVAG